jgi:hypothetical protein
MTSPEVFFLAKLRTHVLERTPNRLTPTHGYMRQYIDGVEKTPWGAPPLQWWSYCMLRTGGQGRVRFQFF